MKKIHILLILISLSMLAACSSRVGFKVVDQQTNEEIKDYKLRVSGHGLDREVKAGEKIKLKNGFFAPPRYKADTEAPGYTKSENFQLKRRFCWACAKMFGTAKNQTIYMTRIDAPNTANPPPEEPNP